MAKSVRQPDVLIVGGGVIGAVTAYELTRSGVKVTVVERGGELAAGCSSGNAGLMRTSHAMPLASRANLISGLRWMLRPDSPFYIRPRPAIVPWLLRFAAATTRHRFEAGTRVLRALSKASLRLHASYADAGIDTGFELSGVLDVYETGKAFAAGRREAQLLEQEGIRAEILDAEKVRTLVPTLSPRIAGAILYPGDPHCEPLRFVQEVGAAAIAAGAVVRTGVEVLRFERRNSSIVGVSTNIGDLHPGEVVLAAGVWSAGLAKRLGVRLPIEGAKGYHVDIEKSAMDPRVPLIVNEARVSCTPLKNVLRFSGTLELSGLDLSLDQIRVGAIKAAARRNLVDFSDSQVTDVWSGLRPCSPDGLPIIGRPEGFDNLVLATGHGMSGLHLGPVTGHLVTELITGQPLSHDLTPLRPDRFRFLTRVRRVGQAV
jgi:D-amino-acid dehydrogenase